MTDHEATAEELAVERVPREDVENWTPIRIEAPLPAGVAGALMQAIGKMWPEAIIETDKRYGGSHYALNMRVPNNPPENLDQQFADALAGEAVGEQDVNFLGFRDGYVAFAPPEELCLALGEVAHSIMKGYPEEIINHLEWTVLTGKKHDDPSYVLSISRSKGQTPLAMRQAAEAEVERLTALLEKHGIDPKEA